MLAFTPSWPDVICSNGLPLASVQPGSVVLLRPSALVCVGAGGVDAAVVQQVRADDRVPVADQDIHVEPVGAIVRIHTELAGRDLLKGRPVGVGPAGERRVAAAVGDSRIAAGRVETPVGEQA